MLAAATDLSLKVNTATGSMFAELLLTGLPHCPQLVQVPLPRTHYPFTWFCTVALALLLLTAEIPIKIPSFNFTLYYLLLYTKLQKI